MSARVVIARSLVVVVLATVVGVLVPLGARAAAPSPECSAIEGLTLLDHEHRRLLYEACTSAPSEGPPAGPGLHAALLRLLSSPGWHAGVASELLAGRTSLTAWADDDARATPPVLAAQATLDAGRDGFAAGTLCPELRRSEELTAFLDAVSNDEPPEALPFTARFATCMGVPTATMEGVRLLTIRADGLREATVIMGTPAFVHARRFTKDQALRLGSHRFFVVAVPEASPVVVRGAHDNQALPVLWRGVVARNELVWGVPPRRSCLDLAVHMDAGTQLYLDGMRIDDGPAGPTCAAPPEDEGKDESKRVDQSLSVTLDLPGSGLPEHEIVALTCDRSRGAARTVVRHASTLPATAPAERLRPVNVCEPLRLDLRTPTKQRVAVLGVTKLPGCEATPLWASDLQDRVRHVLSRDVAHRDVRDYANFSAYAEASEALASLESRMGSPAEPPKAEGGSSTDELLGSAAREAWRQGIDTLLSLAVQCTPRGQTKAGDPQWSYSIRATSIHVSELFARGYHDRDGIDLEDFVDVDGVGFDAAEQQDASIGTLLDRVFAVETPRFARPLAHAPYRQAQPLRVSRFVSAGGDHDGNEQRVPEPRVPEQRVPEQLVLRYKPFEPPGRRPFAGLRTGEAFDRPHACEGLVHRGVRPPDAMRRAYPELPGKERTLVVPRSHDDVDSSSATSGAAVYEGRLAPPRPGWYLVTIDGDGDGELDDAVCIDATAHRLELWFDLATSGGPLAFARNGSRTMLYLRPRVGVTRYLRGGWLGGGLSLGYGLTDSAGTRADWTDLEVADEERQRWRRHALLLSPFVEARSRATVLPVEFRARLGPVLDPGVVDIRRVSDDLVGFRAGFEDDAVLDFDLDVALDLSVGGSVGPVHLDALAMLAFVGADDSIARSATTVRQDANLYLGFGFVIGGGRR